MTDYSDREHVTFEEIEEQRAAGWVDFHPEDFCHKCGRRNISWCVDSDRFNMAMKVLNGRPRSGIICPVCFVLAHEAAFDVHGTWRLVPEVLNRGRRERGGG